MHADWIRRAFDGGLRLLVSLAVDNSLLTRLVGGTGEWDERQSVTQQLAFTRSFVEGHCDWMQVALSPREARQIITSNRLAVVLGMEVDSLGLDGLISPGQRAQWLKELYHDLGLRHIFPIHLTDNAFGGAAVYDEKFDFVNYYVNKEGFELTEPLDEKIDFCFGVGFTGCALRLLRRLAGMRPPVPIAGGCVNAKGLSEIGREELLPAMMKLGMVIDVDHMSAKSISQTLDLVEHYKYPVVAGHCGFRELALGRGESAAPHRFVNEYCRSASEIERISRLGGVVGVGLNQGDVRTCASASVANDCAGTSKSFAQSYLYATSLCDQKGIAIGSDMNGFAGSPGPRFGVEAAVALRFDAKRRHLRRQQAAAQAEAINYESVSGSDLRVRRHQPLSAAVAGNRRFNLNYDGVAHYGMLPDFVQDLHNVGVTHKQLGALFRSAEDYIRMWERCENQKPE
jgi:microsomal dipeptidase-like Zn-dependent dipeptidase